MSSALVGEAHLDPGFDRSNDETPQKINFPTAHRIHPFVCVIVTTQQQVHHELHDHKRRNGGVFAMVVFNIVTTMDMTMPSCLPDGISYFATSVSPESGIIMVENPIKVQHKKIHSATPPHHFFLPLNPHLTPQHTHNHAGASKFYVVPGIPLSPIVIFQVKQCVEVILLKIFQLYHFVQFVAVSLQYSPLIGRSLLCSTFCTT